MKLLEADPDDAFCLYGVAQEHLRRDRPAEALPWFDRCLAADPAYCYAYFHKAKALEALGRVDDAVAALQAGLAQARRTGDRQATSEIGAFLDELT